MLLVVCEGDIFVVVFKRGRFEERVPAAFSSVCRVLYDPVILRVNSQEGTLYFGGERWEELI